VLVVARPLPSWAAFLAGLLVFHYEYAFAGVTVVTVTTVAVARHRRAAITTLAWFGFGAAVSVGIFGAQVVAYYGPTAAWDELIRTAARRGATTELTEVVTRAVAEVVGRYGWLISWFVAYSIVTAPLVVVRHIRSRGSPLRAGLAQLQCGLVLGCLVTATVLRGYFLDGYVTHFLPCLVFPVTVGVATVGVDLAAALARATRQAAVAVAATALAVVMLANFGRVFERYPQLAADLIPVLAREYRGLPFVGLPYGPHLAFALTGAPAAEAPEDMRDSDLPNYDWLRMPDGRLFYLCLDPWTRGPVCDRAEIVYGGAGHTVMMRGKTWAIIELRR